MFKKGKRDTFLFFCIFSNTGVSGNLDLIKIPKAIKKILNKKGIRHAHSKKAEPDNFNTKANIPVANRNPRG